MLSTVFSTPKYFFSILEYQKQTLPIMIQNIQLKNIKKLANEWGFILTNVTTRYPDSNELVERTTETVMKELRKKCFKDKNDPYLQIPKIFPFPTSMLPQV